MVAEALSLSQPEVSNADLKQILNSTLETGASFGAATKTFFMVCYGLTEPFRSTQPPLKKR
jgi:hypothetical protein